MFRIRISPRICKLIPTLNHFHPYVHQGTIDILEPLTLSHHKCGVFWRFFCSLFAPSANTQIFHFRHPRKTRNALIPPATLAVFTASVLRANTSVALTATHSGMVSTFARNSGPKCHDSRQRASDGSRTQCYVSNGLSFQKRWRRLWCSTATACARGHYLHSYVENGLCSLSPKDWYLIVRTVGNRPIISSLESLTQTLEAPSLCLDWYTLGAGLAGIILFVSICFGFRSRVTSLSYK